MRIVLVFTLAACSMTTMGWGQQSTPEPKAKELLVKLRSSEEQERVTAFAALRSDPANLKNPEVRAELVDLLNRENRYLDSQLQEAQGKGYPDKGDNEGWAEYYSDLLGTVDSFANWNDPRQACILADAAYNDDSEFAAEVVSHSKVTMPCLLRRSQSPLSMNRAATVPVLVQALAKSKQSVDPATAHEVRRIILRALQDPDDGVRAFTVNALASFGAEDMIPRLQEIARDDPASEKTDNGSQWFPIRKSAAEAIAEIRQRARPAAH